MATNSCQSLCNDDIRRLAASLGFDACGFARADDVDDTAYDAYDRWIAARRHGELAYMEKYGDIRRSPALLLDGANTVISLAMNYFPAVRRSPELPQFAYYAYGDDYHEVIRSRLRQIADFITQRTGAACRPCVDTAPIRERYWAQRAGIGFVGTNNQLIIPRRGSFFFLAEIVTTYSFAPDEPCTATCGDCRRCVEACPAGAISPGEGVDCRRCLSALTIEHRGALPPDVRLCGHVYGCDVCQIVCPHNRAPQPTTVPEFAPSEFILNATVDDIASLTPDEFRRLFRHSAVRRAKLEGLVRNAEALMS